MPTCKHCGLPLSKERGKPEQEYSGWYHTRTDVFRCIGTKTVAEPKEEKN